MWAHPFVICDMQVDIQRKSFEIGFAYCIAIYHGISVSLFHCRKCSRSKRIDVISRITFPLVFALFNLVYWSTYLFRDEDDQ